MMKTAFLTLLLFVYSLGFSQHFTTAFEKSEGEKTATYLEVIEFYTRLAEKHPEISIFEMGLTDSGKPLHLIVFNTEGKSDLSKIAQSSKIKLLINNGIHPGEPDGIDASMMLLRDIVQSSELKKKYEKLIIAVIPVYNIGGILNRNSFSRVNQNGPESYGFRGNARNYDLNRDFIKSDTRNAFAFAGIFHTVNPDIFIDNHVSNGADYQYVLTHLLTQHDKLGGELGEFLIDDFKPALENTLQTKNYAITPYVNVFNRVPEGSFSQFFDSPRYSTGYTTLFNTLGMMVETHMLKPYEKRVKGTYVFMESVLDILTKKGAQIRNLRLKNENTLLNAETYPIQWEIDSSKTTTLQFKGFDGTYVTSKVTGLKRLKYNRSKPFTKPVTYYNYFKPKKTVQIPEAYLIPQGQWPVIKRLKQNGIEMFPLINDTEIEVESYQIEDYRTAKRPFEGHYLHYDTKVTRKILKKQFRKGDWIVPVNQKGGRYLLETLEPEAPDSFFNWNFFDTILQRKEGFSPYVFEDLAAEILKENPGLKEAFEKKKKDDPGFSKNWYAQLNYIYMHSKYRDPAYLKYPVYRILR